MDGYCCFNCDSAGGGTYRPHDGETIWYIGLAQGGQAHFACENCKVLLFDCHPVHPHHPGQQGEGELTLAATNQGAHDTDSRKSDTRNPRLPPLAQDGFFVVKVGE